MQTELLDPTITPLKLMDLRPRLLRAFYYWNGQYLPKGTDLGERHIYDYELELMTASEGGMYIDGIYHEVKAGDIILRKPGQTTRAIMPYACFVVIADLMDTTGKDSDTYDFGNVQAFQTRCACAEIERLPAQLHVNDIEGLTDLFDRILREHVNPTEESAPVLRGLLLQLIARIVRENRKAEALIDMPKAHQSIVRRVEEYIRGHLHEKLTLAQLAKQAGLSPNYFHCVFRATTGETLNNRIVRERLAKARELLVGSGDQIQDIALTCGFENPGYFSYVFRKWMHMTPGAFRESFEYPRAMQ